MNYLLDEMINKVKSLPELEQEKIAMIIKQALANINNNIDNFNSIIEDDQVHIPNKITEDTFIKTDQGKDLIISENVEEMFNKLGI
jgi:hypothetical protein